VFAYPRNGDYFTSYMSHVLSRNKGLNKPVLSENPLKMIESIGGLKVIVPVLAQVLQKQRGLTIEEAKDEALALVLGPVHVPRGFKKEPRGDWALKGGGPPWASVADAAGEFGISRRTIERWLKSGCTLVLKSGHVVTIPLKKRVKSSSGRGSLVSLPQLQELIRARSDASSPGRKLPKKTFLAAQADNKINPQTAKNMWRCRRAITLLRGVTDAFMLRTIQNQISLQIRRRWKPNFYRRKKA